MPGLRISLAESGRVAGQGRRVLIVWKQMSGVDADHHLSAAGALAADLSGWHPDGLQADDIAPNCGAG